jgi:hypothetical protein
MKYFLISTEPRNSPVPQVTDWFEQIDPRDLTPERGGNIPEWTLLSISNGAEAVFSDILSMPGFLVSPMVHDVLRLYDPYIQCKRAVLIDRLTRTSEQYFLPIFPTCDCLLPESKLNGDRSKLIHGVIDPEKVRRRPFFKIGGVSDTHIAFRLDVTESILRRRAKGIKLAELEIKGA